MELSRKINVLHSDSYKKLLSPNCVSIPKHILISKFFGDLHVVGDLGGIDSQIFYKIFVISNLCFIFRYHTIIGLFILCYYVVPPPSRFFKTMIYLYHRLTLYSICQHDHPFLPLLSMLPLLNICLLK